MIVPEKLIAASLSLEPNRAAVTRDAHRAAVRGISNLYVNENMVVDVMREVEEASLNLSVSAVVSFPIGQWMWASKLIAIEELAKQQNGPTVVMHGVGAWLDQSVTSEDEFYGLASLELPLEVMTSLSAIPEDRLGQLANDLSKSGATRVVLSNGVAASGLPTPDLQLVKTFSDVVDGRFKIAAMCPAWMTAKQVGDYLSSGADFAVCEHFWELGRSTAKQDRNTGEAQ